MSDEIALLTRRLKREQSARKQAESLLEDKSRALYEANQGLTELASSLEEQVYERTKELKEARDHALAASRSKTTFLSTMSHEVRTPMNGIIGMANLLLDTDLTHEQQNQASVILSSSESLLSIINDILDLSKLEAGKFEIHNEQFNLNELLHDIFNSMAITAANKKLELLCQLDVDVPCDLLGDPLRLRQILINLLGNSLKFTQKGSVDLRVKVTEQAKDKVVLRFEVNDTGCGIDEESKKTLFTPFSQGKYDQTNPQGTGLGLSICRRLAGLMKGKVGLQSSVDEGSCFWVEIPLIILDRDKPKHRLQGKYAFYETNKSIAPVLERQFSALGGELTLLDSLEQLLEWHESKAQNIDRFIVDLANLDVSKKAMLFSYLNKANDTSNWLFIRSINEPRSDMTDLIQQHSMKSLLKPITQDKLYDRLLKKSDRQSSAKDSEEIDQTPWNEGLLDKQAHILLVEDNAVNRMVATALLKKCGFTVSIANDGVEAIEACQKQDFSLLLMDIQMPRMGGIESMKNIRQLLKDTERQTPPIIALTANAMEGACEEYMEQGMDDYLTKPIDQARLGKMLERWINRS